MTSIIELLQQHLDDSEAIVIGAGSGLSNSAGFEYGGKTFLDNFKYMNEKYGYTDMYTAGFHSFKTAEEFWGYWSKFIYLNRYEKGATPLYTKLYKLVNDKNYFVITTNVDHQFQKAGFDKTRLFYTQGDYGLFQCSHCKKTFDNEKEIVEMVKSIDPETHKIPSSLVPKCPICGRNLTTNLRCDDTFVENEGFHKARSNYESFLKKYRNKKILFLELGVGYNTPVIIKYPFIRMTESNESAFYVSVSLDYYNSVPDEIKSRSLIINDDINEVISKLHS